VFTAQSLALWLAVSNHVFSLRFNIGGHDPGGGMVNQMV
jgi:hypothetical protein